MIEEDPSTIDYCSFTSSLGWILLGCTPAGVCLIDFLGTDKPSDDSLAAIVMKRCPGRRAAAGRSAPLLKKAMEAISRYLDEHVPLPDLPLDVSGGTPFQRDVWKALLEIPFGSTRSYADLAASLGRPGAARAVGNACGKNPVPILVPCHRLIATGGGLGGYTGGSHIKEALLSIERPGGN